MKGLSEIDTGKYISSKDRLCELLSFLPSNCFPYRKNKASDSHILIGNSDELIDCIVPMFF